MILTDKSVRRKLSSHERSERIIQNSHFVSQMTLTLIHSYFATEKGGFIRIE